MSENPELLHASTTSRVTYYSDCQGLRDFLGYGLPVLKPGQSLTVTLPLRFWVLGPEESQISLPSPIPSLFSLPLTDVDLKLGPFFVVTPPSVPTWTLLSQGKATRNLPAPPGSNGEDEVGKGSLQRNGGKCVQVPALFCFLLQPSVSLGSRASCVTFVEWLWLTTWGLFLLLFPLL